MLEFTKVHTIGTSGTNKGKGLAWLYMGVAWRLGPCHGHLICDFITVSFSIVDWITNELVLFKVWFKMLFWVLEVLTVLVK